MIRGILILSITLIAIILLKRHSTRILSSFFEASIMYPVKHLPTIHIIKPIIPSAIQWKIEPSIFLTSSPAALKFPQKVLAQIPTSIPAPTQVNISTNITISNNVTTLFVHIANQNNEPIANAQGWITDSTQTQYLPTTNAAGNTMLSFPYKKDSLTIHEVVANIENRISLTIP